MTLAGWGRYPRLDCRVRAPKTEAELAALVAEGGLIARGNGRAYGDSAMSAGNTADMRRFNRMISFDEKSGRLVAEGGVLLADVIAALLPRGWFPAVTPGTKFVTLGGMIAADVHGKNHHKDGSMASSVEWIELMGADGKVRRCSPSRNKAIFEWTLGGMGLTGVILRAAIRLSPVETGWIRQETIPAPNLGEAMAAFEARAEATYSVAWIDCLTRGPSLGRSLVMLGEHARASELPAEQRRTPFETPRRRSLSVPFDAPGFALNGPAVRAFNALYWRAGLRAEGERLVDWDSYFYPLDRVGGWNRIYGRKGLAQFQCVLPPDTARAGLEALLREISEAGQGSFLAVLKKFGPGRDGLSFPQEGYTLALDFPVNRKSLALLSELDRIAVAHGGRFYLAKDARLSAAQLREADPRVQDFAEMRRAGGARPAFASAQSERLDL
ncbi:MAG: FAD-binding oxidoreductase [Paracoccaceae bacterium]|nr:FAD-binding oxidoreductase [Paracoccaceae bacterium]